LCKKTEIARGKLGRLMVGCTKVGLKEGTGLTKKAIEKGRGGIKLSGGGKKNIAIAGEAVGRRKGLTGGGFAGGGRWKKKKAANALS